MRNLNGFLKKILSILVLTSTLLLLKPLDKVFSQTTFDVNTQIDHSIMEDTITTTIYYTITTPDTPRVITYYTTTIPQENIKPDVYLSKESAKVEPTYHNRSGATDLVIDLHNAVVSKDSPITFKLVYTDKIPQGNLNLLSKINDTVTTSISISYPKILGEISWSSTPVSKVTSQSDRYEVQIDNPQSDKTSLSFGQSVMYEFTISRNLVNSSDQMYKSEIILPPNSSFQRIIIEKYSPQPNNSYKDSNGNYILQYELAPQSNLPISISGYIFMQENPTSKDAYLSTDKEEYWKISDSIEDIRFKKYLQKNGLIQESNFENISSLDEIKKELFYKLVHSYILERLVPNTLTLGSLTGGIRVGADTTLTTALDSTAEDYSDATIAIFRKFGVPARFVVGYITEISDYNPGGMYHNWIEYYDSTKQEWKILDPFLEDYSNISLLGRELPDHVALIYRNTDPNTPKLPFFGDNDLIIKPSSEKKEIEYKIESNIYLQTFNISDSHLRGYINIKNIGNSIIDSYEISKSNPAIEKYLDLVENSGKKMLLPQEDLDIYFNIPSKEIDSTIFSVIKGISDTSSSPDTYVETNLDIVATDARLRLLAQLISVLLYSLLFVPLYFLFIKLKKKYE